MTNLLLFENRNFLNSEKRNERIELFAQTLNNAFTQFQSLWVDYKEVLNKSTESRRNDENVLDGQKNRDEATKTPTANQNTDKVSEKESIAVDEEKKTSDCNPASDSTSKTRKAFLENSEESFQIFSQDFNTQSLEETYLNQSKTPMLREIQNLTPKRSTSPIFGSRKSKPRISLSKMIDSPNGSQKSVVILDDFTDRITSNSKDPCAGTASTDSTIVPNVSKASSSLIHSSISTPKVDTTCALQRAEKWGLSTMYNTETDTVPGSNKKLKQSKIFVRREKLTDLSNCDDVFSNKLNDRRATGTPNDGRKTDFSKTNDSFLEESLIQVSPNHDKGASKMRQKISRKNKTVEAPQPKPNTMEENLKNIKEMEVSNNRNLNTEITDTEITLFEPKLASTQFIRSSAQFSRSASETSVMKHKLDLKIVSPTNDFDTNDDTLFLENQTPFDYLTPRRTNSEKNKMKKLSLPKKANSSVINSKEISKILLKENDKEFNESEMEISLDSSQEAMKPMSSPQRITPARSNFKPFPKKKCTSPTYVYKGSPVRKKAERALLNGWDCHECENYYKATGRTGEELQKHKNQCSRHRSKFDMRNKSQKGYWDPDFSSPYHSTVWSDE